MKKNHTHCTAILTRTDDAPTDICILFSLSLPFIFALIIIVTLCISDVLTKKTVHRLNK